MVVDHVVGHSATLLTGGLRRNHASALFFTHAVAEHQALKLLRFRAVHDEHTVVLFGSVGLDQ